MEEEMGRLNFPAAKNKERKENIMPRYVFAFTAAVLFSIGIIFGPVSFCFGVFCVGPKIKAAYGREKLAGQKQKPQ